MRRIRFVLTRLSVSLSLAALLGIALTLSVFASDPAVTGVTVTGGTLSGGEVTFDAFTGITLNGTERTATSTWNIADVVDPRGNGAGWNRSLTLSQFKEYDTVGLAYVVDGKALATSTLKVTTAPIVTLADETSSLANTVTPVTVTTPLDTESAVKLVSAAELGGMGSFHVSDLTVTLTVPATAYAKTYKSDATLSLNATP